MRVIWKYEVSRSIELPDGARILTVQLQNNKPWIWALVDPDAKMQLRRFTIFGTGEISKTMERMTYIGTWQRDVFVWHLFEETA